MPCDREVVVTGVGLVTPVGIGREAYWQALLEGRSGIVRLERAAGLHPGLRLAGVVADFDPKQFVQPRKQIKLLSRPLQTCWAASSLALADAGLTPGSVDPDRFGVVVGAETFHCELNALEAAVRRCSVDGRFDPDLWASHGLREIDPLWLLKQLPNMAACHVSIAHDARAHNNSILAGGASGLLAVIEAATVIQRGWADVMIAGSAGTLMAIGQILFYGGFRFSTRIDDPAGACRPFDAGRDGAVAGEGAGALILETRRHAAARGVKILARLAGWHSTFRPPQSFGATSAAIEDSIQGALEAGRLSAADIRHVNAAAGGTREEDAAEAQAIRDCLGDVPVTAPKSYFGDLAAGSGVVELAASVLAVAEGRVPPTLNYRTPDPECPVNAVRDRPLDVVPGAAIKLSQAAAGQAAAVVLDAP